MKPKMNPGNLAYALAWGALASALPTTTRLEAATEPSSICIECHQKITPNIVADWSISRHCEVKVACADCHGTGHQSTNDVAKVQLPTPDTCGECHEAQVKQFKGGKHALAWAAMKAMPTIHWQPMAMIEGMKGCGACHKIGLKTPPGDEGFATDQRRLWRRFLRCLPHTAHLLQERGPAAPGL
jgi:hypothetical protein